MKIEELVIGNDLLPFGDTNERLLSEALSRISGLKSLPVHAESEGRILAHPVYLSKEKRNEKVLSSRRENKASCDRLCLKVFCQLGFIFDILTKNIFSSGKTHILSLFLFPVFN